MLHMPNFTVAHTFEDFARLETHLDAGGIIVAELNNKFFSTRITEGGKRLTITEAVIFGTARKHVIELDKGPRTIARVRTQITNNLGQVLKFEGYYLQYALTPTDLRDEIIKHVPNV